MRGGRGASYLWTVGLRKKGYCVNLIVFSRDFNIYVQKPNINSSLINMVQVDHEGTVFCTKQNFKSIKSDF